MCVFSLDLYCLCLRYIPRIYNCEVLWARWYQKTWYHELCTFSVHLSEKLTDFPLSVKHLNFRIVEFHSVEMLSFSRMRDVFQIEISFLTYHEDICGG